MRAWFLAFVGLALPSRSAPVAADDQARAGCSGRLEVEVIVLHVEELADESDGERIIQAVLTVRGVLHAEGDDGRRLLTVIADARAERVTAARLVQYLELAGYTANEVEDKLRDAHAKRLSNRAGKVIELPASAAKKPAESSSPATAPADTNGDGAAVHVSSLAESLDPLRDRFNADKDKTRFVALLSPT